MVCINLLSHSGPEERVAKAICKALVQYLNQFGATSLLDIHLVDLNPRVVKLLEEELRTMRLAMGKVVWKL